MKKQKPHIHTLIHTSKTLRHITVKLLKTKQKILKEARWGKMLCAEKDGGLQQTSLWTQCKPEHSGAIM